MTASLSALYSAKSKGQPLAVVTAYDATLAALAEAAGVDAILVGDSLGMVIQGGDTTLAVTLDEMIYHSQLVVRGAPHTPIIVDLPFLSYQVSVEDAVLSAGTVIKESGAHAVKLEGGVIIADQIAAIIGAGIPVMGHVGLRPQSIHLLGGYAKQGKLESEAKRIEVDALAVEQAGAFSIVLENITHALAARITQAVEIPTIGIGAGQACDGQVQVFHDLFGLQPNFKPAHAKRYGNLGDTMIDGLKKYVAEVRSGEFQSK